MSQARRTRTIVGATLGGALFGAIAAYFGAAHHQHKQAGRDVQVRRERAELDRLVRGVGQVCISASMLEAQLAFLALTLDNWSDEKLREVLCRTGQALREYKALVPRLEAFGLGEAPRLLLDAATRLLQERNRVVHSVMMIEAKEDDERVYQTWHARSDETREVDPAELNDLAQELALLVAEANAFASAWTERADRDGWRVLPEPT